MNRLFVLFVSLFAMASVLQADENPGQPFQKLYQELGDLKVQVEEAKEAIEYVPQLVYAGLRSGANHWVSPYWRVSDQEKTYPNERINRTVRVTFINILNGSRLESASVKVNVYDEYGELKKSIEFMLLERRRGRIELNTFGDDGLQRGDGWVEVVADRDVFVDGSIKTFFIHDSIEDSESERVMNWYPVKDE